ncbi:MAG: type II toxin-antitoxin system RelE/ParE family toxin [Candidatus Paceibacterota bacterium]|jgi:mRNA-degrading endonuclease YafQ of YafQ-DinJ toxin-antitoxin module
MLEIRYAPSFVRMYARLPASLKSEIKEKISTFRDKGNHDALKVHKLKGNLENTFSFSVNYKIRVIFEYEDKKSVNLLLVGGHDNVY